MVVDYPYQGQLIQFSVIAVSISTHHKHQSEDPELKVAEMKPELRPSQWVRDRIIPIDVDPLLDDCGLVLAQYTLPVSLVREVDDDEPGCNCYGHREEAFDDLRNS